MHSQHSARSGRVATRVKGISLVCFWITFFALGATHAGEIQVPRQSDWTNKGIVLTNGPSGSWDVRLHGQVSPCAVVKKNGTYFMYYIGADGNRSTDGGPRHRALGVATSTDGMNFTKYSGNPILTFLPHQGTQLAEEEGIFSCGATLDTNGEIVMYYTVDIAFSTSSVNSDGRLAVSSNGFHFTDLGKVIDHADSSVWGYGDELGPVGAFNANDNWYVYYQSLAGVGTFWDLGIAWGSSRDNLASTKAVLASGSDIIGGGDVIRLSSDKIALFLVRDFSRGIIEIRTANTSAPDQLSAPVETYDFGSSWRHATLFLDTDTNTWFMYHRQVQGNAIYLRTAPAVGGSVDTTPPAIPTGLKVEEVP